MKHLPKFKQKQKVDNFILEEPLGSGQDGEVWRAVRISIGKSCAIKFLNSVAEEEKQARFGREIQILASLDHANIVQIQDKGEAWNPVSGEIVPYYVMEFLPGRPIHKAIKEVSADGRIDLFCLLFQQVCSALDAAHALGISHGDIKPANILVLSKERIAKVSDFGFGLLPGQMKELRELYPESSYKAPKELTPMLADVYRLGKTMSECLQHLSNMEGSNATGQIGSLATKMSNDPADISLREAASILEQIRTTTPGKISLPENLSETVPELSPSAEAGSFISDPIHGVRNFSLRTLRIVDLPFFQRLRNIRQFPSSALVFPALTISAFEQALGDHTMLIRQLESLGRTTSLREILTPLQLSTTILSGLLLNASRMPFQSAVRNALRDEAPSSQALLKMAEPEISPVISAYWNVDQSAVAELMEESHRGLNEEPPHLRLMSALLHGPLGASALEWVFRTPARAGFESAADIDDLFRSLTVSSQGRLLVKEKKLRTLESFYMARIQTLERLVYQPTIRAADLMLERAFLLLRKEGLDFEHIAGLNDFEFLEACLKYAAKVKTDVASDLLTRYKNRILHKRILSINVRELPFADHRLSVSGLRAAIYRLADRFAEILHSVTGAVIDPTLLLVDLFPSYFRRPELMVLMEDGTVRSASSISPSFAALEEWPNTRSVTLYGPREAAQEIQPLIRDVHHVFEQELHELNVRE